MKEVTSESPTAGFGFSNVGSTTFALKAADDSSKGMALGLIRAATSIGRMSGPLVTGFLVGHFGFQWGFAHMAVISVVIGLTVWLLFQNDSRGTRSGP